MNYPDCPKCNRQLKPIPAAYKSNLVYRWLRWLQGYSDSEFLRDCLEWLVIPGNGNGWQPVSMAWCSCDYTPAGAEGSEFWRGIHVMDSRWQPEQGDQEIAT